MAIGRRKKPRVRSCLLMNNMSFVLARGEILDEKNSGNIQIKIVDGHADRVAVKEVIQIVTQDQSQSGLLGQVIYCQGDHVVLELLRGSGREVRQNLRMPVDFESYIYPRRGGRYKIRSKNLSCGGMAFYAECRLEIGEEGEIVVPITEDGPLLLDYQILRASPYSGSVREYATQFMNLIDDQEKLLREAVFNVQLEIRASQNLAQRRG